MHALKEVDFDLKESEVHVICGENGAGKSTLMKILAGNYPQDTGEINLYGKKVEIKNQLYAERLGISIVYQELSLSPTISVAENIFMGREFTIFGGVINKKKLLNEAKRYLDIVGADIDPDMKTTLLSTAQMQQVEIAKALSTNAKIIIMDEPCSSLSEEDSEKLFCIIKELTLKGISIIYIDHRLENIFKIGDRVTVLRDGSKIVTCNIFDITVDKLVQHMVGREITNYYPKYSKPLDDIMLKVSNLMNEKLNNISFEVKKGEVFGLAGLVGAGRSEIIRAIFGVDNIERNALIELMGKELKIKSPIDAINAGIGYVPEDRKLEGLVLYRDITLNTMLVRIKTLTKGLFTNKKLIAQETQNGVNNLNIKTGSIYSLVSELSGGNQQKVVLARWLAVNNLQVLLLDEPTRGIDVGAKNEIYRLINELANNGMSIILITSELPELLGLSDRIAVINDGKLGGIISREDFSQEKIMSMCV